MVKVQCLKRHIRNRSLITIGGKIAFDNKGVCEVEEDVAKLLVKTYGDDVYEIVGKGSAKPKAKEPEPKEPETPEQPQDETQAEDSNADGGENQNEEEEVDTQEMVDTINAIEKMAELKELAVDAEYPEDEYSSIRSKADMKEYLIGKLQD